MHPAAENEVCTLLHGLITVLQLFELAVDVLDNALKYLTS